MKNIKNIKNIKKIEYLLIGVNALLLVAIIIMLPKFISLHDQLEEYKVSMADLTPISSSDSVNDITVIHNVDFPYCKVYGKNDTSTPRVAARGIWESYILNLLDSQYSYISYMTVEELTILAAGERDFVFELRLNPTNITDNTDIITQTAKSPAQLRFTQMFRARFDTEEHQYYLIDIGAKLDYSDLPLYNGGAQ